MDDAYKVSSYRMKSREKETIHVFNTAVNGELLLCINESHQAYGTKTQEGKKKQVKESHLADQKRLELVFLHINNYNSEWCFQHCVTRVMQNCSHTYTHALLCKTQHSYAIFK